MRLAGLSLFPLLSVLALTSALTVALYLLKPRRRRVTVSFIPLWESLLADRNASRLFARIKHLLSLLIALSIVALLCFSLGDPRRRARAASTRHMVVLIDAGVTMQARDVAPSRFYAAIAQAHRLVRSAGPDLRILVAQMDGSTTPLSSISEAPRELGRALSLIESTDLPTDHQRAYSFALDVLRGLSSPEIAVLSDAAVEPEPALAKELARAGVRLSRIPFGRRGDDVGISAFAVRRYPLDKNRSELLLELYSAARQAEEVELTLLGDGAPIDVQRLTIAPGASVRRTYDDVTGASRTLEARLQVKGDHDDLRVNDRAYAVLPEKRRVRVLCVSDGNRYLEAALLLDEYLDVDVMAPGAYRSATDYDVVIFDRFVPRAAPGVPAFYIEPQGDSPVQPLRVVGRIERPVFDQLQSKHAVLRFTALRDANVASALLVRTAPGDQVLAADPRGPLIVSGVRAGQAFVALTFDVRQSDLPLRVAWPLLLLNSIDWFTVHEQDYVSSLPVGRPATLHLKGDPFHALLRGPAGRTHELPVRDGALVLTPSRAGFYQVSYPEGELLLAANLRPETRRDIAPQPQLRVAGALVPRPEVSEPGLAQPPWALLLLLALLLLTAEWFTYHRRWTV